MGSSVPQISLGWCSVSDAATVFGGVEAGLFEVESLQPHELPQTEAQLVAIDTRRFDDLDALRELYHGLSMPALLIVAPLEIEAVWGRFPVPEIFFVAPEGEYQLLLGDPEAEAPTYELESVREVVLAVQAGDAKADELEANPEFRMGARLLTGRGLQKFFLWVSLGLAVVVLAALTLKVARQDS